MANDLPFITIELIADPDGGFTARVPNIPAYGEGETEEAAIDDLKEALIGYIEQYGVEDALAKMSNPTMLRKTDWTLKDLVNK